MRSRLSACAALIALFLGLPACFAADGARNVILMVADGAGFNAYNAASYYQSGALGSQPYEQPGWVKYACTTYPLNRSTTPTLNTTQDATVVYDPNYAWHPNVGYNWLAQTYTDSAAAATALASGQKTYNNAINWTNLNTPMTGQTIAERAKAFGKSVGVVSTVQWSHATPAALGGAHNVSRNNYAAIANEMLNAPYLDVIMGAGNPEYDDNGAPAVESTQYVGGSTTWNQLKSGTHPGGWSLVQTKAAFEALATGPTPNRVVGTAQAATTLQQARDGYQAGDLPFQDAPNANVPTLSTLTRAALNVLDNNPGGLLLQVEGGAVDWANHANQAARMIEEQIDFNQAVQSVVDWVDTHSNWTETLLIVTADHETGLLWGPSATPRFTDIVNNGPGLVPGLRYNTTSHSNSLVPLHARGIGSELFADHIRGSDPLAAAHWGTSAGLYVDNTDIFGVMNSVIPEPAALTHLAILAVLGRRRRRR